MATASFDYLHFLMKISPDLLTQYAKYHGIDFKTESKGGEKMADEFMLVIEKESEEKQSKFWGDSQDIDEIGTEDGCDFLLNRVIEKSLNLNQKEYEELKNSKERSLYFYLNFYDLFSETCDIYDIENLQGWRGIKTVPKNFDEIVTNIPDFKNGLSTLYRKEYKGRNLKVKHFKRAGGIVFVAYIEDSLTNDLSFAKGDLNARTPRRAVFMAYFLYRPKEGILEVKAKGGKKRIGELQNAFIEQLLKEEPVVTNVVRYDFNRLQNLEKLIFPTESKDLVSSVTLKGLQLLHNSTKKRISIDLANANGGGTIPMISALKEMNIALPAYQVRQFKIEVKFDNLGKGRKRKVTVTITHPNICNLKDRNIDLIVGRLLKKWGLDLF